MKASGKGMFGGRIWMILALVAMLAATVFTPGSSVLAASSAIAVNQCAVVYGSNSAGGLAVRSDPGIKATLIKRIGDGTVVSITGGPVSKDGYTWWKHSQGGWSAGSYLKDTTCPSSCTPGKNVDRSFMTDIARQLTSPSISAQYLNWATDMLVAWMPYENTNACWNPLATTWSMPGSTNFNSVGVKNFADRTSGVRATANTLNNTWDKYRPIRAMLAHQGFNEAGIQAALKTWIGSDAYAKALTAKWKGMYH